MFTAAMPKAFFSVMFPTSAMCLLVYLDYFDSASVDLGFQHYAEVPNQHLKNLCPKWIRMPLNTFVNIGYVIVGAYWCAMTTISYEKKVVSEIDSYLFYIFNFMGCAYGPIQALRILSQLHKFSVLDQWYTLPFFMWVFVWGMYLKYGWSLIRAQMLLLISLSSYGLVLLHPRGFEATLMFHITLAVVGALISWQKYPQAKALSPFIGAILCCAGFVGLKLIDLELPSYHPIFKLISGHFLSKVCDIYQVHFVNKFFYSITLAKLNDGKKKKE
ncbi:hypothetical protein ACJMK2_015545 [Sinanodonta woodiana]|uniref:Transmembrane protein 187 n=1 Tax=Sinanodonta woodiana TaxID=1069815 RepID=A0ABD3UTM1_SINWO